MPNEPEWISTGRAARILGVSASTVLTLAAERRIEHRRLPKGHRRYLLSDIERLANERVTPKDAA